MKPEECGNLQDVRDHIDRIDREIIALIGRRAGYVAAAARFKKDASDVHAGERVKAMILQRRQWAQEENLDPDMIEQVYRRLVAYFVNREMQEFSRQQGEKKTARYYAKDALRLEEDVPGAEMWGVALANTMLTYFEVQPGAVFEKHTHESEQITMVLEGELFFMTDEGEIAVREGEVIALPANVPHGTLTKTRAAKAVDAWSPVMAKYRSK